MRLSILIASMHHRKPMLDALLSKLNFQISNYKDIEIVTDIDNGEKSIGKKRDDLLKKAKGKYCCFIDDDDDIAPMKYSNHRNYIDVIYEALLKKPDCVSLIGVIDFKGSNPKVFKHSISFKSWYEKGGIYYRTPNHLNVIKTSIAKKVGFTDMGHGEDADFSTRLYESGLIKSEVAINTPIYHYRYTK